MPTLITRLSDDFLSLTLAFEMGNSGNSGTDAAELVKAALLEHQFSGICDYFAGDFPINPPMLVVSIALAKPNETEYTFAKSKEVKEVLKAKLDSFPALKGVTEYWQFETLAGVKRTLLPRGSVSFEKGVPSKIINEGPYGASLFIEACRGSIKRQSKAKKAKKLVSP
jgi:hypothetical protein